MKFFCIFQLDVLFGNLTEMVEFQVEFLKTLEDGDVETLRHVNGSTVPRNDYRLVQTPQTFDIQLLKKSYRQPYCDAFTDDASVVEAYGQAVTLVDGNRENIKITTPADLKIAAALFNS